MFESLLDRPGFSFDRLFSFLLVADAGGIAPAAPGNANRQSQMSRQIGELEDYFGKALTERRGRALVLTQAGEQLAVLARETFKGLADVGSREARPARFELGAGDSVLSWWVLPRVHAVLANVRGVVLSLTSLSSADIVRRLEDARLDVGIVRQSEKPRGTVLRTESLGSVEYALFVSKERVAKARSRTVEEVLATVPVALQRSEPQLNECLSAWVRRDEVLECETFPQACRAVRSGEYAALLPVIAREELPARGFVELAAPGFKMLAGRMVLAWHPRVMRQRPEAKRVVEALGKGLRLAR